MLPLDFTSVLILLLVGTVVLSAMACWGVSWSRQAWVMILAAVLPFGACLYDPPQGEFAPLTYMFVFALAFAALAVGALFGFGLRFLPSRWGAPILATCAISVCGVELGRQFVPPSCAAGPIPVAIGGTTLNIPTEMQPIMFGPSYYEYLSFGDGSEKHEYARLCRMTANGTEPVIARTIRLGAPRQRSLVQQRCAEDTPPAWCAAFSAETYDRIGRIDIETSTARTVPHGAWNDPPVMQRGDFVDGAICRLSEDGHVNRCWLWKPVGSKGFRIMVSSMYFDDAEAQSVDQVLAGLSDANRMLRTIIQK